MKKILRTCVVSILILASIIACTATDKPSPTPIATNTLTQSPAPITKTPVPTSTATVALPTPTGLPMLNADNMRQVLTQFVQENGGCKLPCLLGLSAQVSDRTSVENFVQYFQMYSQESNDQFDGITIGTYQSKDYAGVGMNFWKNRIRVDVGIDILFTGKDILYIALSTGAYKHTGEFINETAEILSSHPDYDELLGQFSLSSILLAYGKPDAIWIRPFPEDELHRSTYATGSYPFDFVLIYKGFAVEYMARVVLTSDGYLMGCPNTSYMSISSWNPSREVDFAEIASYFSGTDSLTASNYPEFKPIQGVTSLQVEDFYENYKNSVYSECVKTPRDLWP